MKVALTFREGPFYKTIDFLPFPGVFNLRKAFLWSSFPGKDIISNKHQFIYQNCHGLKSMLRVSCDILL